MAAGTEREALLRFAAELCAELGYAREPGAIAGARELAGSERAGMLEMLSPEDEELVGEVRRGLAELAAAVAAQAPPRGAPQGAVRVALDGAELVMRGELVRGNGTELGAMLPGFVFLVTLPMVDQDEALELCRRAAALIERELGA